MRTIVAGSRGITDISIVEKAIEESHFNITVVLSGTARGVDRLGEVWARKNKIRVVLYPADWAAYGKSAGFRRNEQMAANADALIAVWDGVSRGTHHMISLANAYRLKVFTYIGG